MQARMRCVLHRALDLIASSRHVTGQAGGNSLRAAPVDSRCALFGRAGRPTVCVSLRPMPEMCGASREEALEYLTRLEKATLPGEAKPWTGWQQA